MCGSFANASSTLDRTVQSPNTITTPPRRIEINVESDPAQIGSVRRAIEHFAADAGFTEKAQAEVGLCVNEALANIVRHAYSGVPGKPIAIAAECIESQKPPACTLRVTIRDWGNGVDPDSLPPEPYDPLEPGGVGLLCLRQLMDDIIYARQPDGMLLTMIKRKTS